MRAFLITSLILVAVCLSLLAIPEANALPVSYNQTALNFGLTSVPRNSSSYDVFPLIPDNWLWMKFDNNTVDSSQLSIPSTITYNSNLKALWSFQNTLADSTTNGNNLSVLAGSAVYDTGHEGQGFKFNGATDLQATNNAGLQPVAFSVSFWIYLTSTQSPFAGYVLKYSNGANGQWFFDSGSGTTSNIRFGITTSTGEHSTTPTTLSLNTWHHIVGTYDGTTSANTVILYIDGVSSQTATSSGTWTPSGNTNNVFLGGSNLVSSGTREDEIRFYNTNISSAQVLALDEVGKYAQSHTFDGGEYVNLGNTLAFERTSPFSISTWIKSTSSSNGYFISKFASVSTGWLSGYLGSGQISFQLANTNNVNDFTTQSDFTVNDGNWHYVTITYDGSSNANGVKFYKDAVLGVTQIGRNSLTLSILNSVPVTIGALDTSANTPFIGQLDNTKVYPYALSQAQITSDYNSISPISSGKQFMSWYNGISGSSTLTKKLGYGSTTTLLCSLNTITPTIVSNMSNIYYECGNLVKKFDIVANTNSHVYTSQDTTSVAARALFMGIKHIFSSSSAQDSIHVDQINSEQGNVSQGGVYNILTSNQEITTITVFNGIKFNDNSTTIRTIANGNLCNINYNPSNLTKQIDSIACDQAIPAMAIKYWNGMNIQKIGGYSTNTTQQFLNSIDANSYKKLLSLPCQLYGAETPCITFILTDPTQTDYLVVLTSAHVYYGKAQTALNYLLHNNYALQSYDIITQATTSAYEIQNPILQGLTLYGFNLNTTTNKAGLFTLPSGYSTKTTTINSAIRLIDPRWTNDATDIPIITSTQSLFQIFLTASNAPSFSAIKVTSAQQIINNQESVWAVAQLDSTRSVEFDLPPGLCANVYIADISVSPTVWNFEGIICATGVNQKTIAYTNTVPFTFYTLKYGVTDSYVPANNGLQTTFRTQVAPTTYTVIVRNSTGTVAINQTFTVPANQTIDTRTFNVSSVSKPASLAVSVGGNLVYSAYLGSSLSLATVASFFHQYFSYQGFDLLSFIPIIFASMWTRNTVGAGIVLTVLCIATLSWLSVVVIPEATIYVAIFIGVLAMVGYRAYGY